MKIAILGFPQAGKRTLFTLLSGRAVPEGRKPADVLEGRAPVRDPRVDAISELLHPEKTTYAETLFALCPDVEAGSGDRLWLDAARRCDMLCMVVRAFSDSGVYHFKGSVDSARDRRELAAELMFADLELADTRLQRIAKEKRGGQTPAQIMEEKTLAKCRAVLEQDKRLADAELDPHEIAAVRSLNFLTLKPVLWAYNVDEKALNESSSDPFTFAGKIEQEIMSIENTAERNEYLKSLGLTSSGVDRMNRAAYDAMGLMSFYTMGEDEVRAWTIRKGALAPAAAGKVHTDMERGFIRVEIIRFDDLMTAGSEAAVKQRGQAEVKGKDYAIRDGDICCFRFNV